MSVREAVFAAFFAMFVGIMCGMVIGSERLCNETHLKIGTKDEPTLVYLDKNPIGAEWVRLGDPNGIYHIAIRADRKYVIVDDNDNEIPPMLGVGNEIWVMKRK